MKWEKNQLSALGRMILRQCHVDWWKMKRVQTIKPNLPPLWSPLAYLLFFLRLDSGDVFWKEHRQLTQLRKAPEAHYYIMTISAKGKKRRELAIPDYQLRKHQNFIRDQILARVALPDSVTAYREGYGVADCARQHLGDAALIRLNIRNFFGSIRKDAVMQALESHIGYPRSVVQLLADLCCCRDVLPQGAPTSPALSNMVFKRCDEQLMEVAKLYGATYYARHADELYFSGTFEDPYELISEVEHVLHKHGFQLNFKKTQVMRTEKSKKVVGLDTELKLQASQDYRRKLRQDLHYIERYGKDVAAVKAAGPYLQYLEKLRRKVSYLLFFDRNNEELRCAAKLLQELITEEYKQLNSGISTTAIPREEKSQNDDEEN